MSRYFSGPDRAGRSSRVELTRRGLLGVAAVLTGAGVADLLHKPRRTTDRTVTASDRSAIARSTTAASESRPVPNAGHASPHGATPSAHHGGSATRAHDAAAHHGKHDKHSGHSDRAKIEHVELPAPKVRVRSRPVYSIDELIHDAPKHAIALTVDDGPDPEWTPKVLRLLDKYHMQASFCVVGVHADSYPKLVRDVARAGHVIVNHTFTHVQPFNEQTEKRIVAEITRTQRAIERAANVTPTLFRAPGGAWSPFIFRAVAAYGLTPLDWDIDPVDWSMPGTRHIEKAMLKGRPGDIVLCHDGGGNRSETVRALRKVLPTWKRRGYTTIPLVVPPSATLTPSAPPATPTPISTPSSSASPSANTSATPSP